MTSQELLDCVAAMTSAERLKLWSCIVMSFPKPGEAEMVVPCSWYLAPDDQQKAQLAAAITNHPQNFLVLPQQADLNLHVQSDPGYFAVADRMLESEAVRIRDGGDRPFYFLEGLPEETRARIDCDRPAEAIVQLAEAVDTGQVERTAVVTLGGVTLLASCWRDYYEQRLKHQHQVIETEAGIAFLPMDREVRRRILRGGFEPGESIIGTDLIVTRHEHSSDGSESVTTEGKVEAVARVESYEEIEEALLSGYPVPMTCDVRGFDVGKDDDPPGHNFKSNLPWLDEDNRPAGLGELPWRGGYQLEKTEFVIEGTIKLPESLPDRFVIYSNDGAAIGRVTAEGWPTAIFGPGGPPGDILVGRRVMVAETTFLNTQDYWDEHREVEREQGNLRPVSPEGVIACESIDVGRLLVNLPTADPARPYLVSVARDEVTLL